MAAKNVTNSRNLLEPSVGIMLKSNAANLKSNVEVFPDGLKKWVEIVFDGNSKFYVWIICSLKGNEISRVLHCRSSKPAYAYPAYFEAIGSIQA